MKKAKTIICWVILIVAMGGLGVSTYFNISGVNEWWNTYVSQWVGGASMAVACTTVIQIVVNYSSKADLNLGIRDFSNSAKEFVSKGTDLGNDVKTVMEKLEIKEARLDALIEKYETTMQTLSKALDKLDVILENEKEIANHDESMVRDGTAAKLNEAVDEVEKKYEEQQ